MKYLLMIILYASTAVVGTVYHFQALESVRDETEAAAVEYFKQLIQEKIERQQRKYEIQLDTVKAQYFRKLQHQQAEHQRQMAEMSEAHQDMLDFVKETAYDNGRYYERNMQQKARQAEVLTLQNEHAIAVFNLRQELIDSLSTQEMESTVRPATMPGFSSTGLSHLSAGQIFLGALFIVLIAYLLALRIRHYRHRRRWRI